MLVYNSKLLQELRLMRMEIENEKQICIYNKFNYNDNFHTIYVY